MWYITGFRWIVDKSEPDPQRVYKIVYAKSADGITWEKEGKCIIPDRLNDDECQALPTVIRLNNRYHMFFCYREAIGFRKDKGSGIPDRLCLFGRFKQLDKGTMTIAESVFLRRAGIQICNVIRMFLPVMTRYTCCITGMNSDVLALASRYWNKPEVNSVFIISINDNPR